jgi:hypothetical protein
MKKEIVQTNLFRPVQIVIKASNQASWLSNVPILSETQADSQLAFSIIQMYFMCAPVFLDMVDEYQLL